MCVVVRPVHRALLWCIVVCCCVLLSDLFIERFCMTGGTSPIGYLKAWQTNLYLSADADKVREALSEGEHDTLTHTTHHTPHTTHHTPHTPHTHHTTHTTHKQEFTHVFIHMHSYKFTFSRHSLSRATYSKYRDILPEARRVKCLAQGHNVICHGPESNQQPSD